MQITKINGDRLYPQKIPLVTSAAHKSDPFELKRSFHFFMLFSKKLPTLSAMPSMSRHYPTGTPRQIDVDSTWILRRYVEDQISTNFHVVSTYFFDVISLIEKSTLFPRTSFDVISMVEKSTSFPRIFFNVISFVEISTVYLLFST